MRSEFLLRSAALTNSLSLEPTKGIKPSTSPIPTGCAIVAPHGQNVRTWLDLNQRLSICQASHLPIKMINLDDGRRSTSV